MLKRSLLGGAALLASTSCVPRDVARAPVARRQEIAAAQTLLKRLALNAPVDQLTRAATAIVPDLPGARPAPAFTGAALTPDDAQRAIGCLTAAVYYEARSESADGQRAVAQVVLNRVRDRAFPNSVCGVVYQGSTRATGCQFSFTCDGSMRHALEPAAWDRARAIAQAAYDGAVYAPVGSSTYYHATSVMPWWASSLTRVGQLGSHIFYRWRGLMENALAFRQRYAGLEPERAVRIASDAGIPATLSAETAIEGQVTVHRSHGDAEPALVAASTRTARAAGVRIHIGTAPAIIGDAPGAIVADESDPI